SQSHFVMVLRSSNSRSGSPSHQIAKLHDRGLRSLTCSPFVFHTPDSPGPDAQNSNPLCRGSMSAASPRPTSADGLLHSTLPVRASRNDTPTSGFFSWMLNTSSPGRSGSRSETCSASPCPSPVEYSPRPSEPTHIAP